jgi:hypothetical protein
MYECVDQAGYMTRRKNITSACAQVADYRMANLRYFSAAVSEEMWV